MSLVPTIAKHINLLFLLVALSGLSSSVIAKDGFYPPFDVTGTVVNNHDGDTITLETKERGNLTIRLSGADSPETGQAYWKVARDHLRSVVEGKTTTVTCYKKDRFERDVCHVFVGDIDIGLEMISKGYAWFAVAFAKELTQAQQVSYPAAEVEARQQKMGLWIDPDPMPPGECRKLRRAGKKCR